MALSCREAVEGGTEAQTAHQSTINYVNKGVNGGKKPLKTKQTTCRIKL